MKLRSVLLFLLAALLLWSTTASGQYLDSTRVALHVGPVLTASTCPGEAGSQDPNTLQIPCSGYSTEWPAFTPAYVYLVVVSRNDLGGVLYLSCGIDYGTNLNVDWTLCSDGLEFPNSGPNGPWPAAGGGTRITWTTCQTTTLGSDGVHAVAGAFYIYAYGNDLFQVTSNNNLASGPELAVMNCAAQQTDIMSNPRGAVGFGTTPGVNPCCTGLGVIHVPLDYPTIQEALDAAQCDGDTILVADGVYSDPLDRNLDFGGRNLHLVSENGAATTVIDCQSSGSGLVFDNGETHFALVDGFTIRHAATSAIVCQGGSPTIRNCILEDSQSTVAGGALQVTLGASPEVLDCTLRGNSTTQSGGAVTVNTASLQLTDCVLQGNSATSLGGGLHVMNAASVSLVRCLVAGNRAGSLGGGIYDNNSPVTVTECTIADNYGGIEGGAIRLLNAGAVVTVTRSVFWGNCADVGGEELALAVSATASFSCSVIDPTRVLEEGGGLATYDADTFATDPLFCAPEPCSSSPTEAGDYTLHEESLCLAAASPCGQLIGARDVGCGYGITAIADVGNDQGRQVRIRWNRSGQDRVDAVVPVTFYSVWRRVEANLTPGLAPLSGRGASGVLSFPPGDWEFVQSVPASVEPVYITVAPTLCDSTSAGLCLSTFLVRAQTNEPATYFDTAPDSGYSVDNLAPAAPLNLVLSGGNLTWDEAPEADFKYFTVYGSGAAMLDPSATLIDYTVAPGLDVEADPFAYYHVTATDFAGNEGSAATTQNQTAVPEPGLPATYALTRARPNPCRSSTRIGFDLPKPGSVRLQIFDVTGRLVRTLIDSPMKAGRYTVPWMGRDDSGSKVPPGIYFYRLESGAFHRALKLVKIE